MHDAPLSSMLAEVFSEFGIFAPITQLDADAFEARLHVVHGYAGELTVARLVTIPMITTPAEWRE